MARTYRNDHAARTTVRDGAAVTHYYRNEKGEARRATRRAVRHDARVALAVGNYDDLPTYVGTCGYLTY